MKYMGSKRLIKKDILPILQHIINANKIKKYIEPFVGGANIIDSIKCEYKIGSDLNKYLIEIFKHISDIKKLPDIISKEEYSRVRESYNKKDDIYPDWYKGAVGFLSSFNGRFFDGGYSGIRTVKGKTRNYFLEAKSNLLNQSLNLKDVKWNIGDYENLYKNEKNALIYCDIPYRYTKQYGICKYFDYNRFWDWARTASEQNIVIISEQEAPTDFQAIWKKDVLRTINANNKFKSVEKLFKLRGSYGRVN